LEITTQKDGKKPFPETLSQTTQKSGIHLCGILSPLTCVVNIYVVFPLCGISIEWMNCFLSQRMDEDWDGSVFYQQKRLMIKQNFFDKKTSQKIGKINLFGIIRKFILK